MFSVNVRFVAGLEVATNGVESSLWADAARDGPSAVAPAAKRAATPRYLRFWSPRLVMKV